MQSDAEFYRRRAIEERRAMGEARTAEARELHRIMAEGYEAKAKELTEGAGSQVEDDAASSPPTMELKGAKGEDGS